MRLDGKTAIVTGASRGIGRDIALTLAESGAAVAAVATKEELLKSLVAEIAAKGGKALALPADLSKPGEADRVVEAAVKELGRLDVLVNNAGITRDNLLIRMKDEEWDQVLQVNLTVAFRLTRAATKVMMRQKYGRVVNISSVSGITGNAGQANYAAAKAGLIAFTKTVAKEFSSRNITANVVAPGFIDTDMTRALGDKVHEEVLKRIPLARFGTGADIAKAVLYLASPWGDYVTGQVLIVDGGLTL